MSKKTQPNLIFAILVIAALIAVAAYSTDMLPFATTPGGMAVTSITTEPRIITESTNLQQATFMVTASLTGGSDSIVGEITPRTFDAMSGHETENSLSIRVDAIDETFIYPIKNTQRGIFKYSQQTVNPGACGGNAKWVIPIYSTWWILKRHVNDICIYKTQDGIVGDIDSPSNRLTADITMTVAGESIKKTVDTAEGVISVDFYDRYSTWRGQALWTGNLVTGHAPPSPALYRAIYITGDTWGDWKNKWIVSHWTEYEIYIDAEDDAEDYFSFNRDHPLDFTATSLAHAEELFQSRIDAVNKARYGFIAGAEGQIGSPIGVAQSVSRDSLHDGEVILRIDRVVNMMQVRFLVNAAWLGVKIDVGMPDIISVESECFASGDAVGMITLRVKNVGTAPGAFIPQFADCHPFVSYGTPSQIRFAAGETKDMHLYVSHGVSAAAIEKWCPIRVADVSDSSRSDSASVLMCMTQPKTCTPNDCDQSGSCVAVCKDDATGFGEPVCCSADEVMRWDASIDEYCGWYCKEIDDDEPDPSVCQAECDDKYPVWDVLNRGICYGGCWFDANKDKMLLVAIAVVILLLLLMRTVFRLSPAGRALQYARPPPRY